ncbi:MAG: hypothetical protein DRI54_01895 [Bacteroidetes bacterium]|nr:MAG: hypothetical protein DRI54_01895 [Bacteroidota bacterium]
MPNSYSYLLSLILLFNLPLLAISQDEKVIAFNDLGFQFTIPDEWEGKETESTYILTSENQTGFVTISTLPFADITELKKQINGGIKKGNGFFLAPIDQIETISEVRMQGKFSGLINFSPVIAYIIIIRGEQQQMVMILAAESKENYSNKYEILANEIAASFSFFNPIMPSMVDEYKTMLNNTKLTFIESDDPSNSGVSTGYQTKTTIDLCGQGYFNFYDFSSSGMVSAFSAGNNKGAGNWDIKKDENGYIVLQLKYYDGEIYEYDFEYLNGKIFLDGDHYLRTTDGDLKYKPNCN